MPFYTPLRYPGGKRRLAPVVMRLLEENGIQDASYAEPYAGGAAIALALLFEERASEVHINDLSRPVFAFWHSVLFRNEDLCRRIDRVVPSMREWRKQRKVYDDRESADLLDLGFSAFFLNRTNRSGIIAGGVIGGKDQAGVWSLDARFNKPDLINRIKKIGRYAGRIHLYQMDALKFTDEVIMGLGSKAFAFYDPPYIENGESLYLNEYTLKGHSDLSERIAKLKQPWVVTYDYAAVKEGLYSPFRHIIYGLSYSAQDRYQGREVMFLDNRLKLPDDWKAGKRFSMTRKNGSKPVFGMMEKAKSHPKAEEGPEAGQRFVSALRTVLAVPKESVPNPFSKQKSKPKKARKTDAS